jgi:class 3 adenylate cyclase
VAREQRKLAAILFADVVGSSRLMGRDESGTVARLLEHLNRRLAPAAARCGGRVIRLTGDGGLVEFGSAVDALRAAIEFQQSMIEANRGQPQGMAIVFRTGLHLGDVIVKDDDIYGDDVNVAARLEAEAPPGGSLFRAPCATLSRDASRLPSIPWATSLSRILFALFERFAWSGRLRIGLQLMPDLRQPSAHQLHPP